MAEQFDRETTEKILQQDLQEAKEEISMFYFCRQQLLHFERLDIAQSLTHSLILTCNTAFIIAWY